ncbi:phosphotransferase family protein [Pseudoalteromonas rubra]|uniref:phosphotransferase family protein n=1 Tax=Pseudoalteromonas rubra TaxID=43658 RepID=UPI000F791FF9|nr:aminoglycoside phosphotransferase family protein [Pseudoalteromonas rubra]
MQLDSSDTLKQCITSQRPLQGGLTHDNSLLICADGSQWVCKRSLGRHQSGLATEANTYLLLASTRFALPTRLIHSDNASQMLLRPYIEGTTTTSWAQLNIELAILLLKAIHQITATHHGKVSHPTGLTLSPVNQLRVIWRYFRNRTSQRAKMTDIYGKLSTILQNRQSLFNTLSTFTLNHGDFHPGNLIATPGQQLVPIDWERAHFGDPAFDLALINWHGQGPIVNPALQARAIALYTQCPAEQIQLQKRVICWSLVRLFNDYLYLTSNGLKVDKLAHFEETTATLLNATS